jgi:hypothetical protein
MTRYSRHTLAAAIIQGGTAATKPLNVETGTVTLDDSWAPFIQGSIVAAMPKTTITPAPPVVWTVTRRNYALGTAGFTSTTTGVVAKSFPEPRSMRLTFTLQGNTPWWDALALYPAQPATSVQVPVLAGQVVRLGCRYKVNDNDLRRLRVRYTWFDASNAAIGANPTFGATSPTASQPASDVWSVPVSWVLPAAPAGAAMVSVSIQSVDGSPASVPSGFETADFLEWGDLWLTIDDPDPTFFDGNTTSSDPLVRYSWTGTPGASASIMETGVQGPADPPYQVTDTTTLALLDPRLDSRIALALDERVGEGGTLADFDTDWGPGTLADLDTLWGGGTLADITATYFDPWNGDGVDGSRLWIDAGVRSRTIDHKAQTVTITFASDESMMQDWALLATVSETPGSTSVKTAVAYALRKLGFTLDESASDGTVDDAAALEWFPGTSAWDYVQPLCQTVNLRLWCDESRVWRLDPRDELIPDRPGTVLSEFVEATDSIDRDGTWYDGVVVVFEWTDDADVRRLRRDIAGGTAAARVLTVNYATPYPGKGIAGRILKRMQRRGRVLNLGGVSAYTVYPSTGLTALPPDTVAQTGTIERVAFSFPEASMSITTRGLVDTGPAAWLLIPEGESWLSNPPGGTWTNEVIGA